MSGNHGGKDGNMGSRGFAAVNLDGTEGSVAWETLRDAFFMLCCVTFSMQSEAEVQTHFSRDRPLSDPTSPVLHQSK
jgi:hypothetical protein